MPGLGTGLFGMPVGVGRPALARLVWIGEATYSIDPCPTLEEIQNR